MRKLDQMFHRWFVKPALTLYLRRERRSKFDGFELRIQPGVFHPMLFFSTRFLYDHIKQAHLRNRSFLELGCGSGLLSLLARRKEALVTAVDVDQRAVENARTNAERNFGQEHGLSIFKSDLFEAMPGKVFDYIVINPPYYFKSVQHPNQLAWYCGEEGEYFTKLFSTLVNHIHASSEVYMILADTDDERVDRMAAQHGVSMKVVKRQYVRWEQNTIYKLEPSATLDGQTQSV